MVEEISKRLWEAYDNIEIFATGGKQYSEKGCLGAKGPWALSWCLSCIGIFINLIQARIIWEERPWLSKYFHQIAFGSLQINDWHGRIQPIVSGPIPG